MINETFLDKVAQKLLSEYSSDFVRTIVVLPNKRAKLFLLESIKNQSEKVIISPKVISIEDFIQDLSKIRKLDAIEVLFEFYTIYLSLNKENAQDFDFFANWGKTLLQDFNEIDRYLLDADYVLSYIKDIEDIKRWGLEPEEKTSLLENYVNFWKALPVYYKSLYQALIDKKAGYQGLIYREAVKNLDAFIDKNKDSKYIFAGFNALNAAEEKIFQQMSISGNTEILWDADISFFRMEYHDAGLFLRRFSQKWSLYKSKPFEWRFDDFAKEKNIKIIGTSKNIGQARIVGNTISEIISENPDVDLTKMAIVLGDENLLIPLLQSLPKNTGKLNITMGYSSKNNPVQILVAKLFKLHINAIKRNPKSYVFYHKDLIDILTHPLVEPYCNTASVTKLIRERNYSFIDHKTFYGLQKEPNLFFSLLFEKWDISPLEVLGKIKQILEHIKVKLQVSDVTEKILSTFVFSIFKVINKMISYCEQYNYVSKIETIGAMYKQIIEMAEVSFEGEPLVGLQIMGVLESRVLDFETVIITGMNEGKFPAGKSQNSFIPYDVKRELGLPTFKEKDAIYTYHFYHLLQRAKNVILIYNAEKDGFDAGEKSRFITQLLIDKQDAHKIEECMINPELPNNVSGKREVPKSDLVMERLKEISEKSFSPSAMTSYIRNPFQFYLQKVLKIREADDVEESIALNTLGTIVHKTLESLYIPFVGRKLTLEDVEGCKKRVDEVVLQHFKTEYKEGEIKKGRNLLAFEVAKRNVNNFLRLEMEMLKNGDDVEILALEKSFVCSLESPMLPYRVNIGGELDRVEVRNNILRVIDYKTGMVESRNLKLDKFDGIISDIKYEKIIQLLAYGMMLRDHEIRKGRAMEVGIISFKNMREGFMGFKYGDDGLLNDDVLRSFEEELVKLISEILDKDVAFVEK